MEKQWYEQKEAVKTSLPIKLTLSLVRILPLPAVCTIVFPVSFCYFIFSKRARGEVKRFQKQMKEFTGGHVPYRITVYRTIFSFSLYLIERIAGWVGKIQAEDIFFNDDDIDDYWENLESGRGVMILSSHLGNIDLLRSLSTMSRAGLNRVVPVTVIMEIKSAEKFNAVMKTVNPNYELTAIDPMDIGPDTILQLQKKISRGEIIVATGDRVSAHSKNRFITTKFLGKEANFPYGVFLMASLLECPIYYCFGLRDYPIMVRPVNSVYMEKSFVEFKNCGKKMREEKIKILCEEYVRKLEKYCMWFPNQWYNFFDFWNREEQ